MGIPKTAIHSDGESGSILDCHIQPGATRGRIVGEYDGRVKIAVAAPPVDGKANKALIAFCSKLLGTPTGRIALLSGDTGRKKRLRFAALSPEALLAALQDAAGEETTNS